MTTSLTLVHAQPSTSFAFHYWLLLALPVTAFLLAVSVSMSDSSSGVAAILDVAKTGM